MDRHSNSNSLLALALPLLKPQAKVLDLACGNGRNGLELEARGFIVTYLDRDQRALANVGVQTTTGEIIAGDLEATPPYQLPLEKFDAIMVFRYLHRPLFTQIIAALKPGGLIIYETFNRNQASIGRPKNPNFLLEPNELLARFKDFEVKYFFDGFCDRQQAYLSQIIARK